MKTTSASGAIRLAGKVRRARNLMTGGAKRRIGIITSSARSGVFFFLVVAAILYTVASVSSHNNSHSVLPQAVAPHSQLDGTVTGSHQGKRAPPLMGQERESML